jgi:hypothetical protein
LVAWQQVEVGELDPSGRGIGVHPDDLLATGIQVGQPPDTGSLGDDTPELGLPLHGGPEVEVVDVLAPQAAGYHGLAACGVEWAGRGKGVVGFGLVGRNGDEAGVEAKQVGRVRGGSARDDDGVLAGGQDQVVEGDAALAVGAAKLGAG